MEFAIARCEILFSQTPDGNRHEIIEFITCVYGADGDLVGSVSNIINTNIIPAYDQFQHTGIPLRQTVSVPAKGEYYLRVAMHDVQQDRVGAIEIPVSSISNLPPLPAEPFPVTAPPPDNSEGASHRRHQ